MLLLRNKLFKLSNCSIHIFSKVFSSVLSCSTQNYAAVVHNVLSSKNQYGVHSDYFNSFKKQKIVIEFSSPNIAKLFHVGHYRSTVIGMVLSNILESVGHDVYRINYLGDWGLQFALVYLGCKNHSTNLTQLSHLHQSYIEACADAKNNPSLLLSAKKIFARMENNDPELLQFWNHCRELSIENFKSFYSSIGIYFDEYSGESYYRNQSDSVIEQCKSLSILKYGEDKSFKIDLGDSKWLQKINKIDPTLLRNDGTSLYITRDILAAVDRHQRLQFDKMIYVTDQNQVSHFKHLFASLEALGYEWANFDGNKLQHCSFGRVKNMKSRDGQAQMIEEIFDEASNFIKKDRLCHSTRKTDIDIEMVAKTLALTGLTCHDLKGKLNKGYTFSWDNVFASKGRSGLLIQYTHCRLYSLEQSCGFDVDPTTNLERALKSPEIVDLLDQINQFSDVIQMSYIKLEPCYIVQFLYDLCHKIAIALRNCKVIGSEKETAKSYLLVFYCARIVVGNGLRILGINPLQKM